MLIDCLLKSFLLRTIKYLLNYKNYLFNFLILGVIIMYVVLLWKMKKCLLTLKTKPQTTTKRHYCIKLKHIILI